MINRAIMTGMLSVGVDVHDYGVTPLPVVRYLARSHREEKGGVHARKSVITSYSIHYTKLYERSS